MSTENIDTNDGAPTESLDDFAAELFGGTTSAPDNAKSEEVVEETEEANGELELDTQTDDLEEDLEEVSEDDDTLATDEDDDEPEAEEKPKKKNRFQERIDELTAARKEAERKAEERLAEKDRELAELRAKLEGNNNEQPKTQPTETSNVLKAPHKTDLDENGNPKYPLGEYDPQFMRDTVEHMLAEREARAQEQQKQQEAVQQQYQAKQQLQAQWNTKLDTAQERYPDFQEKGQQMLSVFEGIDEQYGDYLTTTLMEMDNGPDVFYYLASNVEEAKRIVEAGPKRATMALAKLEAQFAGTSTPSQPVKRVSSAKTPPPQNKGSAVVKPKVAPDTDDLSAFERELFRKA